VREIQRENRGYYLASEELLETLEEAYLNAIDEASLEVEEGRYEPEELEQRVNKVEILHHALNLIALLNS
jgi:hypothetical protein